jgi:inhibitor of cysteine peptidase
MRARSVAAIAVAAAVLLPVYVASGHLAATAGTITVGPAANGSQRTLHRGDVLAVRLPSSPSTGFAWTLRTGARSVLSLAGRVYVPPKASQRLGAPGTAVLRLRAAAAGKTVLRLAYGRLWEQGVAPARMFALHVTVV